MVPLGVFRTAHKRAFFEPRSGTLKLFERFNPAVKDLVEEWWEKIETSEKFSAHRADIIASAQSLKPGDTSLVGLIAEGGQGLATANNARFLGYLEGTPQADEIIAKREAWTRDWLADVSIKSAFLKLIEENGGDPTRPTKASASWEACVEPLRAKFGAERLGFGKSDLYRMVQKPLIADLSHQPGSDSCFAWAQRKAELFDHWRTEGKLREFWSQSLRDSEMRKKARSLREADSVSQVADEDFCNLCQEIQKWLGEENAARKAARQPAIPRETLGLRSSEDYYDPQDAPRVATIYNGLSGRGRFVPFRKGDPEGNRWLEQDPLFIDWSAPNVDFLFSNSGKKAPQMPVMRNPDFFLRPGVSWTRGANHVPIKVKMIEPAVVDVNAMKISALPGLGFNAEFLLAVFNSDVFSFFLKKFIAHTWMAQISDLRMMPIVIPTQVQADRLEKLARQAMQAKRLTFTDGNVAHALAAETRDLSKELVRSAPLYLRPDAQTVLLTTAADCLQTLELMVNWEVEKLYGVEGLGPFDEF